jgi:hypothetical protein
MSKRTPKWPATDLELVRRVCRDVRGETLWANMYVAAAVSKNGYHISQGNKVMALARKGDPAAQKAVRYIASLFLDAGQEMPEPLRRYITEDLRGKIKPRAGPGRRLHTNAARDFMIASAVARLTKQGLPPTRNRASIKGYSACSIAKNVLEDFGIHLTESAVEKIYYDMRRKLKVRHPDRPK